MTEAKMEKIAADMLLPGMTMKGIAERNGVSDRTLRNLRKTEAFQRVLATARAEAFERVFDSVCAFSQDSVQQLIGIMNDPKAPASARVSASRSILEYAHSYYNQIEILERIAALEQHFERMTNDEQ